MKLICLDTETTGFSAQYDRIIEIGCVDITNGLQHKTTFQRYINPKRSISEGAIKVHGLTCEFLQKFDSFESHIEDFLNYIKDATLIIHNANFDMRFLNAELTRYNKPELKNVVIDTVTMAKALFPGKKASLDALKNNFNINIQREHHGALLDAEILAQVYLSMKVKQTKLEEVGPKETHNKACAKKINIKISQNEQTTHNQIIKNLKEEKNE